MRALIVGQTPPPHNGQSIMIDALLSGSMPQVERRHVRMAYSRDMEDVGRFQLAKLTELLSVVARVLWALARFRPHLVLYPPAGPMWVPVLRDIATLVAIRPFVRRLVFHFHAAGVSELWSRGVRPRPLAWLFRRAYFGADLAIMVTRGAPDDGGVLCARRSVYVHNGVPENAVGFVRRPAGSDRPLRVLFAGVVIESKGVFTLVDAARRLWDEGADFRVQLMGSCAADVREALEHRAGRHNLHRLELLGVRSGEDKWAAYAEADVFCFPTQFPAETLPLVCQEAMMFSLPVVATRWRGVPEMVVDEETGLLVEPGDDGGLSRALRRVLEDTELRAAMGARGRRRYESSFTLARHVAEMERELVQVGRGAAGRPAGAT